MRLYDVVIFHSVRVPTGDAFISTTPDFYMPTRIKYKNVTENTKMCQKFVKKHYIVLSIMLYQR